MPACSCRRLCALVCLSLCASVLHAASIWIEGEEATLSDVTRHSWYTSVKSDALSGGEWLSHFDDSKEGTAEYQFTVEEDGEYVFWLRANPLGARMSVQLDTNAWREIDLGKDQRDNMNIAADSKPDLRFITWLRAGTLHLTPGTHTLRFRFHSANSNHGAIDCFCLTTERFVPSGLIKPGSAMTKEVPADASQVIWIEGEAATSKNVSPHPWWYDKVKKDLLSGGEWLHHFMEGTEGTAEYQFNVTAPDTYTFWLRANPAGARISYQLDDGAWQDVPLGDAVRDNTNIADDDKVDLRFIAWARVGQLELAAGAHTLRLRLHSENSNHGGIDCLVFTRIPYTPSGTAPPMARVSATGPADWFPVVFDDDEFSHESVINMAKYIDVPAGKHGFLKRAGATLQFEQAAQPVKFWGCSANLQYGTYTRAQQTQRIRYLRKHGVNMVRQHPVFAELGPLQNGQFDPARIDEWDWWFAELKSHGLYMTWSVFYPLLISADDGYDPALFAELEPREGGLRSTYGIVNAERALQDLQLRYLTALLQHTNAYTGRVYADEPSLAVLEIHNEDCIFFHMPLSELRSAQKWPLHAQRFRRQWHDWATNKYGSAQAVSNAWGRMMPGDNFTKGELEFMAAYHLDGKGPLYEFTGHTVRAGDFIQFLTELQRTFYTRREQEIRALGFKGVTISTAWRAGGAAADPANLYCDTACEMISRHNYCGGGAGGHAVTDGDVNTATHLSQPGSLLLSMGLYQVEDHPFCMTEWSQCPPNQWKLEAAPLVAFYGLGLQGWDASYHFLNSRTRPGDGWPNLSKYVTDTPHYIGQFPALFFALHHGHITEAPAAAARRITVDALFRGTDPLQQDITGGGHDDKLVQGASATPLETLAVGKVTVGFDGGQPVTPNLRRYWDRSKKIVRSMTGELTWDYGRRLVTLTAPKTQAIIGHTGGQRVQLPGVTALVKTPFVSLIFTPLDNQPLTNSARILITAMARDKQYGTQYSANGRRVDVLGAPPLLMEPVQASFKLRGADPAQVNVLDVYGVPTGRTVPVASNGVFTIDGRYQTYYYEVRR